MKFFFYLFVLINLLLLGQSEGIAQNLVVNHDFEADGGSLNGWGFASGTTIGGDLNDHYAVLHGENGILYQRIGNITPGKNYQCTMVFKNLKVKQTTGYGYAVETGSDLVLPVFTVGATNLKDFCQNNNGAWTTLEDNLSEQNVTKSFQILIPDNATAVFICLGTKGATSDMQVSTVEFFRVKGTNVSFLVKNKVSGAPLENAEISISGFSNLIKTNLSGVAAAEIFPNELPYLFNVSRDWFKLYQSEVKVGREDLTVVAELDSISEVKSVKTRISKYGDNATPYPLYGHLWNAGMNYSDIMADSITKTLDYIVGGGGLDNSLAASEKLHRVQPGFQIIRYQGGWDIKASLTEGHQMDLLYYRCGVLSAGISASDNSIVLNSTPDNKGLGLVPSEKGNFTTWIRIEEELMKVVSVSGSSYPLRLTVERGYGGTVPRVHNTGAAATAPLFEVIPVPGGNNANMSFFDPVFGTRKSDLLQNTLAVARDAGQDGIWIDILVGLLGAQNMVGGNYTLWNHKKEEVFSNEDIISKTKDALSDLYTGFYARMGYYPVIYGNNVLYSSGLNPGDRAYVMVRDAKHPRVLDGFCHENSWGHMSDESGNLDNDGGPIVSDDKYIVMGANGHYLEWYLGNTWLNNCKAIALLAENNLPNQPMTINAGYKNQWFAADLTNEVRYNFNKFAYVSYLLCVNVASDSLISCRMGISPQVVENGITTVNFQPFFYYPVGVPAEYHNPSSFSQYRVGNNNLYARKFSNGIVLINPFSRDMDVPVNLSEIVSNGKVYIDPENNNAQVNPVILKSRESKILLLKQPATSINKVPHEQDRSLLICPVPTTELIRIKLSGVLVPSNCLIRTELFSQTGKLVKQVFLQPGNVEHILTVTDLPQGLYFVRLPELNLSGKFLKVNISKY